MSKITDLSLKWRIYWFYLLLGLVPLLVIAYFSVRAYTRSIQSITDRHLSQMVHQIAQQTDLRCDQTDQDVEQIAGLPFVRRSFHEFHNPLQLNLLQEKLERTRLQTGYLEALALYSNQMERLASTAGAKSSGIMDRLVAQRLTAPLPQQGRYRVQDHHLFIFNRVQAFHDPHRPAGYLLASIPLAHLVKYLQQLEVTPGTAKTIHTLTGEPIYALKKTATVTASLPKGVRTYVADIDHLQWRIRINIPEDELFADVRLLLFQTLSFTTVVAILAGIASLVFSRRFMRPFDIILAGTRAFARGDLNHRIAIPKGQEAQRLAQAFNIMAAQLNDRQMELVQSNKLVALGLLSAGIAHEIKNPLAGIKTSAQVLGNLVATRQGPRTSSLAASDDMRMLSQGIVTEVDRLNTFVMDLLEFGRPSPSQQQTCRIDHVLERAVNLIQKEVKNKQIAIDARIPECMADVDPDQLLQVFINLLLNAVTAVPPSCGRITVISSITAPGAVRISIKDNGRGISEENLNRIFDPFFSLNPDGTGLGLSVAYKLLQQNKIKVEVHSRINQGTTFSLTFPSRAIAPQGDNYG